MTNSNDNTYITSKNRTLLDTEVLKKYFSKSSISYNEFEMFIVAHKIVWSQKEKGVYVPKLATIKYEYIIQRQLL